MRAMVVMSRVGTRMPPQHAEDFAEGGGVGDEDDGEQAEAAFDGDGEGGGAAGGLEGVDEGDAEDEGREQEQPFEEEKRGDAAEEDG